MAAPLNYFTGPEWAPLPQYQLTPTGKPIAPAASPLAPNGDGMTLQPFPLNGQAGGRGPLGTPLFPGRTNPALPQQPQMPGTPPMGGFGGFGGMNDSGPSFAGPADNYNADRPGDYQPTLGEMAGLITSPAMTAVNLMYEGGREMATGQSRNVNPTETLFGFQNPFSISNLTGGGRGQAAPASFTVGQGQPGPTVPAVPPQAPVEMSPLGDPGAGGYSGYSGGGYSGFDGVDVGSLADMGYSGGFGIGW